MTVASVAGTALTAASTIAGGNAARGSANYTARQIEQNAMQERAAGQQQSMEKRRQTALVQSQLQARAAASGAGATDATVLKLGEDISGRGEQSALLDMANGESRARGMENQANAARVSGQNQRQGALLSAAGTIASGLGSAFGKYRLPGGGGGVGADGMPIDIANGFG